MALAYITIALVGILMITLLVENYQLKKTIDTKDKAYEVLSKAYNLERNK